MKRAIPRSRDPLLIEIQHELMPGRYVRYDDMFDFVRDLEQVEAKLAALVETGEAERAIGLYEIFLAAAHDKFEECDDSNTHLSMFWQCLLCGWIKARQAAGRLPAETVELILRWKEDDDYCICFGIEKEVVKVLDREEYRVFVQYYERLVDEGLANTRRSKRDAIFEHENNVRLPALSLKDIYETKRDTKSYAALCERTGLSPRDCERLVGMEMLKRRWKQALAWLDKGLELEPTRNWHNEASHSLESKKPEILAKLGRRDESLAIAWADFGNHPSQFRYELFMKYVPKSARADWHARAMELAERGDLDDFIDICVATKEWEQLATRIHATPDSELERMSHYHTEPAAKGLSKRDLPAAAKLYRALGVRILISKKSKYYSAAISSFRRARDLYRKTGMDAEWQAVVDRIHADHSRKSAFMPGFERLLAGKAEPKTSFAEKAQARWAEKTGRAKS